MIADVEQAVDVVGEHQLQFFAHHGTDLYQRALLLVVGVVVGLPQHLQLQETQVINLVADMFVRSLRNFFLHQPPAKVVVQLAKETTLNFLLVEGHIAGLSVIQLSAHKMAGVHPGTLGLLHIVLEALNIVQRGYQRLELRFVVRVVKVSGLLLVKMVDQKLVQSVAL